MAREVKEMMLAELSERFADLPETGCVLIDYQGLGANQAIEARRHIKEKGAALMVIRNRLFNLMLEQQGQTDLSEFVRGNTAVVHAEDPVSAAKAVKDLAEEMEAISIRGGYAEGRVLDAAGVEKLADIPSREELLSMIAGALLSPVQRLVNGLLDRPRALLNGLQQLKDKTTE